MTEGDRIRKYNYPARVEWNEPRYTRAIAYLQSLKRAGPATCAQQLNRMAFRWQREIVAHCPVDEGLLRSSITVDPAQPDMRYLTAQVGTNVPYAVFIEFGTQFIAGGQVKDWQPGDPPILDWPAKSGGLSEFAGAHADRRRELVEQKLSDGSRQEFMPPFRASWDRIADAVLRDLRQALVSAIRRGAA